MASPINDALGNKARSSLFQDDWLQQIDKVTALTNKDLYKLTPAKSQWSFSKTISSFPPSVGWNKIKEWLHYNFGSVATKQHAASMLIDQQQKPSETLQEYIQNFSDLLLKASGLLLHQVKDLAHIMHFICNLDNQKLQHYMLGKNPSFSAKHHYPISEKRSQIMHHWRLT